MNISKSINYAGVDDHAIDLFEGQYVVPEGMSYNSYVIMDEKIAVMDAVDAGAVEEWLANVEGILGGRIPDYLVVHHMEPDHSAGICAFMEKYPSVKIVSSQMAFVMMQNFYGTAYEDRRVIVKEGSVLDLGSHKLQFIGAPNVHWPEVLMSYETTEGVLFSADGFGKFGALDAEVKLGPDGKVDLDEDWACEARRYYTGIVGKFGANVQAVLKKAANLNIQVICPLHGPVLKENLGYYLKLYDIWSSYSVESQGVMIAYTSVYGNTKQAVLYLEEALKQAGCKKVVVCDLAREDMAEAVEDAFRYGTLVLATTTYNGGIFPYMHTFIDHLTEHNYQNRKIALIENGAWAPQAAKVMKQMLEQGKNLEFAGTITIKGGVKDETKQQLAQLAAQLAE